LIFVSSFRLFSDFEQRLEQLLVDKKGLVVEQQAQIVRLLTLQQDRKQAGSLLVHCLFC
jgi:hypothetical protein